MPSRSCSAGWPVYFAKIAREDREIGGGIAAFDRLALGGPGQEGVVEIARALAIGAQEFLEQRATLGDRLRGGEDGAQLPRRLVADPAEQPGLAALDHRQGRGRRDESGVDLAA